MSIIFFGDGSLPLHPALSQVLQSQKEHSLLSVFLSGARLAIQDELVKLPIIDRQGLPDLADLQSLTGLADDPIPDHQALAPAMLLLIQLGEFIM